MSLNYLFYSQQQRNDFRENMKEDISSSSRYDLEIYLTHDGKIVPVTHKAETPNPGSEMDDRFDDYHPMGRASGDNSTRLVDHASVTDFGREIAGKMGIAPTFEAFYTEAIRNLPAQKPGKMLLLATFSHEPS